MFLSSATSQKRIVPLHKNNSLPLIMWTVDPFNYNRRKSSVIKTGDLLLGGSAPIRVQSMANTDTNDIKNSVDQAIRIIEAGGELVRFTAQGIREAESLAAIHQSLREKGFSTPLVADIHFTPNAADVAAQHIEKVRINPGNYVKSIKRGGTYTDEEFLQEQKNIRERFVQFLTICKANNTAIRIGVNHGSLSERMMNKYGDTPLGMVESCMEFLKICVEESFHQVVISMKASNTVLMVQAVRLLVARMEKENMRFPLHLGVTEAGDGEDGRIKSAVGIGSLLVDGIGDTIRVSLSEDPECEIPVAVFLRDYVLESRKSDTIIAEPFTKHNPFTYERRKTNSVLNIGGEHVPVVIASQKGNYSVIPDYVLQGNKVCDAENNELPIYTTNDIDKLAHAPKNCLLQLSLPELNTKILSILKQNSQIIVLVSSSFNSVGEFRAFFHTLMNSECHNPVILHKKYQENDLEKLQIQSAVDFGALLIDGFGDGIFLENEGDISVGKINSTAFGILQASRVRTTKTEYISCPSCGRTLFSLQTVIAKIKARTAHLKGLKIGIMGCIVNGPGEMADADYGYVGTGKGKVSLYKKKECIEKNIPEEEAVEKLIELIKQNGDWKDI